MSNQVGKEIIEAQKLFWEFELTKDHFERVSKLEDALNLLDDCILDQDESQARIATNLRHTYTRKLLENLPAFYSLDIDDWFSYTKIFLTKLKNEVETICSEDTALQKLFNAFINIWANEAIALVQNNRSVGGHDNN